MKLLFSFIFILTLTFFCFGQKKPDLNMDEWYLLELRTPKLFFSINPQKITFDDDIINGWIMEVPYPLKENKEHSLVLWNVKCSTGEYRIKTKIMYINDSVDKQASWDTELHNAPPGTISEYIIKNICHYGNLKKESQK